MNLTLQINLVVNQFYRREGLAIRWHIRLSASATLQAASFVDKTKPLRLLTKQSRFIC